METSSRQAVSAIRMRGGKQAQREGITGALTPTATASRHRAHYREQGVEATDWAEPLGPFSGHSQPITRTTTTTRTIGRQKELNYLH
jgi:hypothetical protein